MAISEPTTGCCAKGALLGSIVFVQGLRLLLLAERIFTFFVKNAFIRKCNGVCSTSSLLLSHWYKSEVIARAYYVSEN